MNNSMPDSTLDKRSDLFSLAVVTVHVVLVFSPVYVAATLPFGWWLLLPWLVFGLLMNGLLNLMHEAAHYHVFRWRDANDMLGRWALGPLVGADFGSYRQRHWDHHRHLGEPEDPKISYHQDIRGRRMLAHVVRCLLLVEAAKKFSHLHRDPDVPARGDSLRWFLRTSFVQISFVASLAMTAWLAHRAEPARAALGTAAAYLFVYVYGLGSVTVLAASIRAIAEHQMSGPEDAHTGEAALRNFSCNPITRLCFGAYGFGEHATHHHRPAIPYYRLKKATLVLAEKETLLAPTHGYIATICTLIRRRPPA